MPVSANLDDVLDLDEFRAVAERVKRALIARAVLIVRPTLWLLAGQLALSACCV